MFTRPLEGTVISASGEHARACRGCARDVRVRVGVCASCACARCALRDMCACACAHVCDVRVGGGARAVCAALGCVFPPGPTPGLQAGPGAAVPALTRPSRPRAAPVSPLQFLHYPADTRVMGDLMQNPELVPHHTENFSQSHK